MSQPLLIRDLLQLAEAVGTELTEARIRIYVKHLSSVPPDAMHHAIEHAIITCKFFPSISELLELSGHKSLTLAEEAEQVWTRIQTFAGLFVEMPLEGVALEVVKIMGGRGSTPSSFGQWSQDQEGFKRKDFIRLYVELKSHQPGTENAQISQQEASRIIKQVGAR